MISKKKLISVRILFVILISVISFCLVTKEVQNDTFYMIKLGDYIVHNGIDLKEHWSWINGLLYTYPHWLYDVFIYYVYNFFGFVGVYLSSVISFIILIIVFYFVSLKINKNEFLSLFCSVLLCFVTFVIATARAQVFSYIIFLLEIYYIFRLIEDGKIKYIFYLCFLSLLLANIHGTVWLFFFILFLPFFGHQFIYYLKNKYKLKINNKIIISKISNFKYLLSSFFASFMMGIFTPSRICYSYVFRIMLGDSQEYIFEHLPLVVVKNPMFLGLIVVLLIVLIFTNTKIKFYELFMLMGLSFMSLLSTRHVIFFYLIGLLFISIIIMRCMNNKKDYTFDILFTYMINKWFISSLLVIIIVISCLFFYSSNNVDYVNSVRYPVDAVNYMKDNLDYKNLKLFNHYNYGSYLMFYDIPMLIDSRCDLYLNEFNKGVSIYDDVVTIRGNYKEVFDKYGVEYVLIENTDYLYELLIRDVGSALYSDDYFTLFKYR